MPKIPKPNYFRLKVKADFEIVLEAKDKNEVLEWAEQVLPEIINLDGTHSSRLESVNKELTIGKVVKVKLDDTR